MTKRLLLSYLTVTLFVLIVLEVPFAAFVADQRREELVTSLERDALILATIYEDALDRNAPYSPDPAVDYATANGTRVVVVDVEGRSIVDTARAPNEDFTNRPEIEQALQGAIVNGRRESATLGRDLLYVAAPVASGGTVYGAVRITADPAEVDAGIRRFWLTLVGVGMVVMASMALVGWVIAKSVARPVEEVQQAAARAAEGDLDIAIDPADAPPELRRLVERFNEMAARLRETIERQRAFVGDASHQLRTPLTALRLRLENVESDVGEDLKGDISAALVEVDRLARIVEQLLALARSEDLLPRSAVDLVAVALERAELWASLTDEETPQVAVEYRGPSTPVFGVAVTDALEQILDNLIDNAVRVSPPGSTVTIEVVPGSERHRVVVSDEGPGMGPDEIARAFDRFWRKDTSREGSGLGLAIVHQLVQLSGGTISLEPASGGGLVVTVEFAAVGAPMETEAVRL